MTTTAIYVQGFPPEVTTEEDVFAVFSRCGLIKKESGKPKIKLYRHKCGSGGEGNNEEDGKVKGDCLVTFVQPESVFLAIQQFDGAEYKPGFTLQVAEAEFQPAAAAAPPPSKRGGDNDSKEAKMKRARRLHERAQLSWDEDGVDGTSESALLIVVLKGMFVLPSTAGKDAEAELFDERELERDLIEGLSPILKTDSDIRKITVFRTHPEAVIVIRFNDSSTALACVELMDGRWFDGRKLGAELWDGVTEYAPKVEAADRARQEHDRLVKFESWVEEA